MTIVDTTVWVDYLRGRETPETEWLDRHLQIERLGLTDLILCEVLQGVTDRQRVPAVLRELLKLEVYETRGVSLAVTAAEHYRRLRSEDYTVRRTIDCLIATFCLQHDHALLHHDRDFDPFEQVLARIIHERFCYNRTFAAPTSLASLIRRPGGRPRRSGPQRTVQVRVGSSRLRASVSRRDRAISRRTVVNNAG
jgi:predicted nucleic acid-binding protein